MKKLLGIILCFCVCLSLVIVPVNAGTVDDLDNTQELAVLFDYEQGGLPIRLGSGVAVWNKDAKHALEYYCGSWSSGAITNNAQKGNTGVSGSIVNSSDRVWNYSKGKTDTWATGGGFVLHVNTPDGPEPIILENGVTYKLSFDYMVESTHILETFVGSSNNTAATISETAQDLCEVGYGYRTTNSSGYHPLSRPGKVLDTVVSYRKTENELGTFTGANKQTCQVGSWYHVEYTFTPTGLAELDFSQEGTITPPTNAPFLIIYKSIFAGTSISMDNVKLTKQISGNINAMGGTLTSSTFNGFVGDPLNVSLPTRYGYDFAGFYTDGMLINKYTSDTFEYELHNNTLFASWDDSKIGFESYAPASSGTLGSKFKQSFDKAASGKASLVYKHTKSLFGIELDGGASRKGVSNMFTIKPLSKNGMYKITFKYFAESGGADVKIYPVTVGTSSSDTSTYKAYDLADTTITVTSADAGSWKTAVIYFTADMLSGGNNLGLHAHAESNTTTTLYFDDITVKESTGGSYITVNAGEGTINGNSSETFSIDYGDSLYFDGLYLSGKAVEGYYYDAAFNNRCTLNAFTKDLANKTLYVKWSDTDNLEYYRHKDNLIGDFKLTKGFANSFVSSATISLNAQDNNGKMSAMLLDTVEDSTGYVIEFYYYTSKNTKATVKPVTIDAANISNIKSNYEGFTLNGTSGGWKKAALVILTSVSQNTSGAYLGISVTPEANTDVKLYIDDITVKKLGTSERCVIFDTMSIDGNRVATFGNYGSAVNFPVNPTLAGKSFAGWYHEPEFKNLYSATTYSSNYAVYAKMTQSTAELVLGDANGDGKVNTVDLALVKKYIAGYSVYVTLGADINGDQRVSAVDLVKLYKLI